MIITSPNEMSSGISKTQEAIREFENRFADEQKDQNYYHLVIIGEYNRETCDNIEKTYLGAGWSKVKCRTSSENGERPGLTGLQLYK